MADKCRGFEDSEEVAGLEKRRNISALAFKKIIIKFNDEPRAVALGFLSSKFYYISGMA
jgi:hypothetical protein